MLRPILFTLWLLVCWQLVPLHSESNSLEVEASSLLDSSIESLMQVEEILTRQSNLLTSLKQEQIHLKTGLEAVSLNLTQSLEELKLLKKSLIDQSNLTVTFKKRFEKLLEISKDLKASLAVSSVLNSIAIPVAIGSIAVTVITLAVKK